MFVVGNLLKALVMVCNALLSIYFWIIIAAAVVTWIPQIRNSYYDHPIVRGLKSLTEPVLYRIRKLLPFTYIGGLDLSPVIVLAVIEVIQIGLVPSLYRVARALM